MMKMLDYIAHLEAIGASQEQVERVRSVYVECVKWIESPRTTVLKIDADGLRKLLGEHRPCYVTFADYMGLTGERHSCGVLSETMLALGFRRTNVWIDRVKTRIWLRGEWKHRPPRYNEVPPCPVPPPSC